ncbi:hypothetical protein [Reinekea sp. G2M2-21]|uniref:hypothetical protein n=1 Tax=Reinekea sp. G2M2-21 TaxID=2788942 RepID=UPI0018ABCD0C|nr:hypothetical protein [Reinekea sp. G2M2-21]
MAEPESPQKASWFVILSVTFIVMVMAGYVMEKGLDFSLFGTFSSSGRGNDGSAEGSLQPAVDTCKRAAKLQIGPALLQMDMDRLSTRYIADRQQYLVILNVIIKGQERMEYYYECTVSSVTQEIDRTRLTGPPGSFEQIGI